MSDLGWVMAAGFVVVVLELRASRKIALALHNDVIAKIEKLHEGLWAPIRYATGQLDKEHEEREFKRAERDAAG